MKIPRNKGSVISCKTRHRISSKIAKSHAFENMLLAFARNQFRKFNSSVDFVSDRNNSKNHLQVYNADPIVFI